MKTLNSQCETKSESWPPEARSIAKEFTSVILTNHYNEISSLASQIASVGSIGPFIINFLYRCSTGILYWLDIKTHEELVDEIYETTTGIGFVCCS